MVCPVRIASEVSAFWQGCDRLFCGGGRSYAPQEMDIVVCHGEDYEDTRGDSKSDEWRI